MNKLSKIKIVGLLLIAGAVSPAMMADTVVLTQGPYSYGDGGEFTATTDPTLQVQYSPYTSTATSFQTFCVETDVEFAPGSTYTYTLNSISLGGPGSGSEYPAGYVPLGTPDSYQLTEGTAWLYAQFACGTLGGYDFANALGARNADAGALQAAIWELQGGQSLGGFPSGLGNPTLGTGNIFYDEAYDALGSSITNAATTSTDFDVEIMNLTQYNGGDNGAGNYQNQLVYLPDGGSTVLLLGVAMSGLAFFRRRF